MTKPEARIESAFAAFREWQRGAITFAETLRRADLAGTHAEIVKSAISRTTTPERLRAILAILTQPPHPADCFCSECMPTPLPANEAHDDAQALNQGQHQPTE